MTNEVPTQPVNGLTKYRQDTVEKELMELSKTIKELEEKVNAQEVVIATLRERLSVFSMAQAVLTVIVGAVAAWIGRSG